MKNIKHNIFIKLFTLILIVFLGTVCADAFSVRNMTLKFAQISDSHISDKEDTSYKMLSQSKMLLKDAVKQINEIPGVDFVMFTGDMVNEPLKDSYKDFFTILSELNYPSLVVFGNHDFAKLNKATGKYTEGLKKNEALDIIKKCNRNYMFEKSYYAFSPKTDYRIIVLDPTIEDEITPNGYIPQEQLEFLDNELSSNTDKVIVIFQHHPVVEPFVSEDHKITNAAEYLAILQKYKNPIAVFSGHYHTTKIIKQGNLIFVSTPSLVTYPNAFRLVNITNYSDRTIFDFYFKETDLKETQAESKVNTIAAATFYGTEKDRNTTLTIKKARQAKVKQPKKQK